MTKYIKQAVEILKAGGLVAMPTETVYGLAADARNSAALQKIFLVKQRPADHPLIVHVASLAQVEYWVSEFSTDARRLAYAFWPGPLTLILKKAAHVSDLITGKQTTIAIRIPAHLTAQALLQAFGGGLAAPSANRFGRISPTTARAVRDELGENVDLILEGGQCEVGVESTILDASTDALRILRPGIISKLAIEKVLQKKISSAKKQIPRVSGSHVTHYAPQTLTKLIEQKKISKILSCIAQENFQTAILSFQTQKFSNVHCIVMPDHPEKYAHDLYATLRNCDKKKFKQILIQKVPKGAEWDAVRDRINKATSGFSI